jgi:hypothetical protein
MISLLQYNKTKSDLFYVKNFQFSTMFKKFIMRVETCIIKYKINFHKLFASIKEKISKE